MFYSISPPFTWCNKLIKEKEACTENIFKQGGHPSFDFAAFMKHFYIFHRENKTVLMGFALNQVYNLLLLLWKHHVGNLRLTLCVNRMTLISSNCKT